MWITYCFAARELVRCDVFVCSERGSLFTGLGVSGTAGLGVEAASESDWPDFFACDGLGLLSRSAASAPAIRICSSVGSSDADFLRDFGLVRSGSGVADSAGVCSEVALAWELPVSSREQRLPPVNTSGRRE